MNAESKRNGELGRGNISCNRCRQAISRTTPLLTQIILDPEVEHVVLYDGEFDRIVNPLNYKHANVLFFGVFPTTELSL
jgi:hypothetical protein